MTAPAGRTQSSFGACPHDCPDTCALHYQVADGRVVEVSGRADHPATDGFICAKVAAYPERIHHPDRLHTPLRRDGPKGSGRFVPISWDQALGEICARWQGLCASPEGPQTILPYSYSGTLGFVQGGSLDMRFFHRLGASKLDRTICSTAGEAGFRATMGGMVGMDVERFAEARLILLWGTNPITSSIHLWSRVARARARGAMVVVIDPYRSQTAARADWHIPLRPGSDAALALGLAHVLIRDDRLDYAWLGAHTHGFAEFEARAREFTPARVAELCGLASADVERLADLYASKAPAAIRFNYGATRHAGGASAARAVSCLPALTGAWRHAAGGILLSSSGWFPVRRSALERPDLSPPGTRTINMSCLGDALLSADPPIRSLYVYNSNPAAVAPDAAAVRRGLAREDLFTVVHDLFLTDTADWADLVLPATSQAEQFDLHKSYGHLHLVLNPPAIAPLHQALPNTEVFRRLAQGMGFDDACLQEDDRSIAQSALDWEHPHLAGRSWQTLLEEGWVRLALPDPFAPFAEGGFPTADGRFQFCLEPEEAARIGLPPVPDYLPPRESAQSDPELARRFPLTLLTPPARHRLNSSFANQQIVAGDGAPRLEMHPGDASRRGLASGSQVRVHNARGAFQAELVLSEAVQPGVVVALSLWWHKHSPDGWNANAVTSQALSDGGRGATFYDCLVEVEAWANGLRAPGIPGS
jgi:anaerobic selenocysteine-containing dehydrogenase